MHQRDRPRTDPRFDTIRDDVRALFAHPIHPANRVRMPVLSQRVLGEYSHELFLRCRGSARLQGIVRLSRSGGARSGASATAPGRVSVVGTSVQLSAAPQYRMANHMVYDVLFWHTPPYRRRMNTGGRLAGPSDNCEDPCRRDGGAGGFRIAIRGARPLFHMRSMQAKVARVSPNDSLVCTLDTFTALAYRLMWISCGGDPLLTI